MKLLAKTWSAIYHLWYYVVVFLSILIILPFIYITSLKADTYNNFFWWARRWAMMVLIGLGFYWRVKRLGKIDANRPYIIIGNHASEIDIMMMLILVKNNFVFIGKKELASLPLFGYFYKRTNILVDRKSLASKKAVLKQAGDRLQGGTGVCVFPEGGIPATNYLLAPFKAGAFKLAIDHQIPILPITFPDHKRHFGEFWDGGYPGILRATVHEPIAVDGLKEADISALMARCYKILHDELRSYGCTGKTIYDSEKPTFAAS